MEGELMCAVSSTPALTFYLFVMCQRRQRAPGLDAQTMPEEYAGAAAFACQFCIAHQAALAVKLPRHYITVLRPLPQLWTVPGTCQRNRQMCSARPWLERQSASISPALQAGKLQNRASPPPHVPQAVPSHLGSLSTAFWQIAQGQIAMSIRSINGPVHVNRGTFS